MHCARRRVQYRRAGRPRRRRASQRAERLAGCGVRAILNFAPAPVATARAGHRPQHRSGGRDVDPHASAERLSGRDGAHAHKCRWSASGSRITRRRSTCANVTRSRRSRVVEALIALHDYERRERSRHAADVRPPRDLRRTRRLRSRRRAAEVVSRQFRPRRWCAIATISIRICTRFSDARRSIISSASPPDSIRCSSAKRRFSAKSKTRTFKRSTRSRSARRSTDSSAKRSTPANTRARKRASATSRPRSRPRRSKRRKRARYARRQIRRRHRRGQDGTHGRAPLARKKAPSNLIVTNRTMSRAQELIAEVGFGEAIEMPGLVDALAAADIVVTSTGASHFVVTHEPRRRRDGAPSGSPALHRRHRRAARRDPLVAAVPNVALVDIDGLRIRRRRKDSTYAAKRFRRSKRSSKNLSTRFGAWYRSRLAVPVIASLTQKAEAIRVAELERLFARCPDLTEREKMLVTGMSMTIVSKLLHSVVVKIREKATSESRGSAHARAHARRAFRFESGGPHRRTRASRNSRRRCR